jgi:hypothetical protein
MINKGGDHFCACCGILIGITFCVAFTLSHLVYFAFNNRPLDVFASADGDLRLLVYRKIQNDDIGIDKRKIFLESVIRSEKMSFEITGRMLPFSVFRSRILADEFSCAITNFYAIKQRNEK